MSLNMDETGCTNGEMGGSCQVSQEGQQGCQCASPTNPTKSAVLIERPFFHVDIKLPIQHDDASLNIRRRRTVFVQNRRGQQNILGSLALGIACIASPCCTPIIIPGILALLAGTPAALWLTQNIGWLYGGLTLISVISLALGLRWVWHKFPSQNASLALADKPDQKIVAESHTHSAMATRRESAVQPVLSQPIQVVGEE